MLLKLGHMGNKSTLPPKNIWHEKKDSLFLACFELRFVVFLFFYFQLSRNKTRAHIMMRIAKNRHVNMNIAFNKSVMFALTKIRMSKVSFNNWTNEIGGLTSQATMKFCEMGPGQVQNKCCLILCWVCLQFPYLLWYLPHRLHTWYENLINTIATYP